MANTWFAKLSIRMGELDTSDFIRLSQMIQNNTTIRSLGQLIFPGPECPFSGQYELDPTCR